MGNRALLRTRVALVAGGANLLLLRAFSGLARYLPGQWWFVPVRAHLAERDHVRPAVTAASIAVERALLTGSALSVALIGAATVPVWQPYAPYLLSASIVLTAALLASPHSVEWLSKWALKLTKREPLLYRLSTADTACALVGCWANWLLYASIALFSLASLSGSEYLNQAQAVMGLFIASVLGGSLGLLVPQGLVILVIREGVLVYLLHTLLGIPVPIGIGAAALTRLLAIAAEGVWTLFCLRVPANPEP